MAPTVLPRNSLKTRIMLTTLGIVLTSLWALSFYASQMLRKDMERLLSEQQFSTASMVAAQVSSELDIRFEALEKIAALSVEPMLDGPVAMQTALQNFLQQRFLLHSNFNGGVVAYGADGTAVADVPRAPGRVGVNYMDVDAIAAALKEGRASIGRPQLSKNQKSPEFSMAVPIRDNRGQVIGALAGTINLDLPNVLTLLMGNSYGKTGGYLLVAPQHRMIVTATDRTRVMEASPAPGTNPVVDRFLQGYEGSAAYVNPRGVEVLQSTKSVPVAGWYVAAVLPTAEAFAPIRDMQQRMWLATIILTVLAGGLSWWILRRQFSALLRTASALAVMSETQQPPQSLPIVREDEIGQLIGGFNRLLENLAQQGTDLRESEERFRALHNASFGGIAIHDRGVILDCNQGLSEVTGYAIDELVGMDGLELIAPDWRERVRSNIMSGYEQAYDVEGLRKDGTRTHLSIRGKNIPYKGRTVRVTEFRDITQRKQAEEEIRHLAFYDQLTGLPNRRLLTDRLEQALATGSRHHREGALLFIDLDDFKTLNDTLGHDMGDVCLQQVARRLVACVREGDTVSRFGGDEFVVMLGNLSEHEQAAASQAETVGEKILTALNRPFQLAGGEHRSTASIGIALFADRREVVDDLLKRADLAMYEAKAAGRNTLRFFDPEMQAVVTARAALETGLRAAVEKEQFVLHYQAQVDSSGQVIGGEVLLRWNHPELGLVPPGEFIPLAEEAGLILPIGQWVMETACSHLAEWSSRPELAQLAVAVNVSARQLHHAGFVPQVLAALERSGADPHRLKLELTESLLVHDVEDAIAKMSALKAAGVGFSLDDFGTGYSSLSYLKRLPLDQLKIDRSFIDGILVDSDDAAIARMIVDLGASLGLDVIAEGVETDVQKDLLARLGCHAYQGYLFSRPIPKAAFEAFVAGSASRVNE